MTPRRLARKIDIPAFLLTPFVADMQERGEAGVSVQNIGKGKIRYHIDERAAESLKRELREAGMKLRRR